MSTSNDRQPTSYEVGPKSTARLSIVHEIEAEVDANLKRAQALRQAVAGPQSQEASHVLGGDGWRAAAGDGARAQGSGARVSA